MTTSTTSSDITGMQSAYDNLHTEQARDYVMQRYHDVISSCGGTTSYGADNRPFFFFQAEDGIRDLTVTGVQTCALPIYAIVRRNFPGLSEAAHSVGTPQIRNLGTVGGNLCQRPRCWYFRLEEVVCLKKGGKIGRASCRERV